MGKRKRIINSEVAIYALVVLRGAEKPIHTEDIAAKCAQLAPEQFGWRLPSYRKQGWADLGTVRRALKSASSGTHGDLLEGTYSRNPARDGWVLSEKGLAWFKQNAGRIEKILGQRHTLKRVVDLDRRYLRNQMDKQPLFGLFMATGSLEDAAHSDFGQLLKISPHSPRDEIAKRFLRLQTEAQLAKDADVITFLKACQRTFKDLL